MHSRHRSMGAEAWGCTDMEMQRCGDTETCENRQERAMPQRSSRKYAVEQNHLFNNDGAGLQLILTKFRQSAGG